MATLHTIFYFVIALGILVFVHEFGHFIVAKLLGIGVEKFSIGFGPKLFSFRKGETEYMVSALPFGGYVKPHGEDPEKIDYDDKKSFMARPLHHRAMVVLAGPMMNFVLALFLMPMVFMIGHMEPGYWDQKPIVENIVSGSPAEKNDFQKGDEILSVDGKPYNQWKELTDSLLLRGGENIEFKIKRNGQEIIKLVTLEKSPKNSVGRLGIEPVYFLKLNLSEVDEVLPESPAAKAGLQEGDIVTHIDGVAIDPWMPWSDMTEKVQAARGKTISVTVLRKGTPQVFSVTPEYSKENDVWLMGVKKSEAKSTEGYVNREYSFVSAIVHGTKENINAASITVSALWKLITGKFSYKALGGPIKIAEASGQAASYGASAFIYFLAFFSVNLGLLNLIPLPIVDGGHLMFYTIEAIIRRPIPQKARSIVEQGAFILLILLMVLITLHDLESVKWYQALTLKIKSFF